MKPVLLCTLIFAFYVNFNPAQSDNFAFVSVEVEFSKALRVWDGFGLRCRQNPL